MRCGKCATCILIQTAGDKYAKFPCRGIEPMLETPPPVQARPDNRVCRYRGVKLLNGEAAGNALDARRDWFRCGHPERPLGEFVCPCQGCNASCRGYGLASSSQTMLPSSSDIDQTSPGG